MFNFMFDNSIENSQNLNVTYSFSDEEFKNLALVFQAVRLKLNSRGKSKVKDCNGDTIYIDYDIYNSEQIYTATISSILKLHLNVPVLLTGKYWQSQNRKFIYCFFNLLVNGAILELLPGQLLLEAGCPVFSVSDNGIEHKIESDLSNAIKYVYDLIKKEYLEDLELLNSKLDFLIEVLEAK